MKIYGGMSVNLCCNSLCTVEWLSMGCDTTICEIDLPGDPLGVAKK